MRASAVLAAVLLVSGAAVAGPAETAENARRAEENLDYDIAADLWMTVIGHPEATREQLLEAHVRAGIIALVRDNDTAARLHFREALKLDPDVDLPGGQPPKVTAFFAMVEHELADELAARQASPPEQESAAPEAPAPEAASDEGAFLAWLSLGSAAGVAGLGAVILAAASLVGTGALYLHFTAESATVQLERVALYDQRDFFAAAANVGFVIGGAVALAGGAAVAGTLVWVVLE